MQKRQKYQKNIGQEKHGTEFAGGTGTQENPYIITNGKELKYFQNEVAKGNTYAGKYIKQTQNIYLNNTEEYEKWNEKEPTNKWIPIGDEKSGFSGTYDGGNNKIEGIYVKEGSKEKQGLFGYIYNANIKNIVIEKGYIEGGNYTGGIVGHAQNSSIDNSKNKNVTVKGANYVGGISGSFYVGAMNGEKELKNCINEGNIEGAVYVGGVVGECSTNTLPGQDKNDPSSKIKMYNINNKGKVTGKEQIGGIAGSLRGYRGYTYLYNSSNSGDVLGEKYLGGCAGNFYSSDGYGGMQGNLYVGNFYNVGNIQSVIEGEESIGGIYGDATCQQQGGGAIMKIENCYSLNKTVGTQYVLKSSWASKSAITENNIVIKSQEELKSQEFLNILNEQKEKDKTTYGLELKTWVGGNEQTKEYPKFED